MAIQVLCPGCGSRFSVSDRFAGKTGPCPKCKKPITIPTPAVQAVTIHEPEPAAAAGSAPGAHVSAIPFRRIDKPVSAIAWSLTAAGAVAAVVVAWLVGLAYRPGQPPPWLLLAGGFAAAIPCVMLGYAAVRDRELEPYRGRSLAVRTLICAVAYAALWAAKGSLPTDWTADMWQWLFLGPLFCLPGALAALATLDLDWGPAAAHFSMYVLFTALLRWLAGLLPL